MVRCKLVFNIPFRPVHSKPIIPLDDAEEVTGSVVRSYVTVERPTGGKQIRKARQYTPGKTAALYLARIQSGMARGYGSGSLGLNSTVA